jgi:actin-related protein
MFEKFKIKSLALMNTAVLSLFATGKTSGIVTEVGEGTSYACPVFEGYALPHAKHKLEIAGKDVTEEMIRQLSEDKINVTVEKNFQHVREIKEQMGSIALNYESDYHAGTDHLNEE